MVSLLITLIVLNVIQVNLQQRSLIVLTYFLRHWLEVGNSKMTDMYHQITCIQLALYRPLWQNVAAEQV